MITPRHDLTHRGNVVNAFNGFDFELAILRTIHLAVIADDHAGDVFSALNV
ncbi:hypothetical protein D3C83_263900 [compost metagenome]